MVSSLITFLALKHYPKNFKGLGKLRNCQVKPYTDNSIKPVAVPPGSVPYHLKTRVCDAIDKMLKGSVIEEHPINDPSLWVFCAVTVSKTDGSICITLDTRNVSKAIISTNQPIPKQEDIRSQLAGARYFSKTDFKSIFCQLEIHPDSRYVTVFHATDRLYQHTRLIMRVEPAQGELNTALKPILAHIPNVYLIHDDLIIAAKTFNEHNLALEEVMKAIDEANLTLNQKLGMIFSSSSIRPDPEKVKALENLPPRKNRSKLKSFICMMQSNSGFIPNFSKGILTLRELLNSDKHYKWA